MYAVSPFRPTYTALFDGKKGALSLKNACCGDITHGN